MYSGSFVLQGVLSDDIYKRFLLLFVGLRILSCKQLSAMYCDYANELLVKFVKNGEVHYGKSLLVYNVHSMIHLAADVKKLGCIKEFSAFQFENKLGHIKKLVHKPQHPIQQSQRGKEVKLHSIGLLFLFFTYLDKFGRTYFQEYCRIFSLDDTF